MPARTAKRIYWDSDFFAPSVLRNSPPLPIEEPTWSGAMQLGLESGVHGAKSVTSGPKRPRRRRG